MPSSTATTTTTTNNNLSLVKTASVLTRNDFMYSKMLKINAGLKDGVIKEMAVVNHRGLVGRTVDSSISNSKVLLLTDPFVHQPQDLDH